jgi:TFIIF-interacting CTD phosphatase-like protein
MVVVIDDRGDVWEWCENLVKVKPCMSFSSLYSIRYLLGANYDL